MYFTVCKYRTEFNSCHIGYVMSHKGRQKFIALASLSKVGKMASFRNAEVRQLSHGKMC